MKGLAGVFKHIDMAHAGQASKAATARYSKRPINVIDPSSSDTEIEDD